MAENVSDNQSFMRSFSELQALFTDTLTSCEYRGEPLGLYTPVNYMMALGGKRIRPVMVMMACELFGGDAVDSLPAALSVETFHNFTLMHDDIMDEAPLRRGKETVHMRYGVSQGILSGDLMLIKSYSWLMDYPDPVLFRHLMTALNEAAVKVCEGQQWDVAFETKQDVSIDDYLLMIEYKTAALLAASLEMGALVGGATGPEARKLYECGRLLGIAFQLLDDLLDSFGDPAKFGKKVGGDIAQNKKTFLYLKALELAQDDQRQELQRLFEGPPSDEYEKISQVRSLFEQLNIPEVTRKLIDEYQILAFSQLDALEVPDNRKEGLRQLAGILGGRQH